MLCIKVLVTTAAAVAIVACGSGGKGADEQRRAQPSRLAAPIAEPVPAKPQAPPEPGPTSAVAAPDLAAALGKPANQVAAVLGSSVATEFGPDVRSYQLGSMKFLVTYREHLALDIIIGNDGMTPSAIRQWLGLSGTVLDVNGRRFAITDGSRAVSISDTALPKHRVDIKQILGKRAAAVRQVLGKAENEVVGFDVFKPWAPDDRIGVTAYYDPDGRATSVDVGFDDGPLPPGGNGLASYATQLQWLGLPVADEVRVGGERYSVTISGGSIELKKR